MLQVTCIHLREITYTFPTAAHTQIVFIWIQTSIDWYLLWHTHKHNASSNLHSFKGNNWHISYCSNNNKNLIGLNSNFHWLVLTHRHNASSNLHLFKGNNWNISYCSKKKKKSYSFEFKLPLTGTYLDTLIDIIHQVTCVHLREISDSFHVLEEPMMLPFSWMLFPWVL